VAVATLRLFDLLLAYEAALRSSGLFGGSVEVAFPVAPGSLAGNVSAMASSTFLSCSRFLFVAHESLRRLDPF
jgi:hypothetical protein